MSVVRPEANGTVWVANFNGGHVERQKPCLRHALSVRHGDHRQNLEYVVERVMPDFSHIVPIQLLLSSRGNVRYSMG